MALLTLPVADAEFDDGNSAQGTEVRSQDTAIKDFINGGNLDGTDNINTSVAFSWTGRHSWSVSDSSNDNISLVVSAVMATGKYGFKIASSAAQINSSLFYMELSNASSTVSCIEFLDAGTGSTLKVTKSGNGKAFEGVQSGSSNSADVFSSSQAGTGNLFGGSLRSLSGLNTPLTAKILTTSQTVSNDATETSFTDLNTTLPSNFLKPGTTIKGTFWGTLDTPGAGPADARIKIYYGGTAGTVLLDTGAFTPATSLSSSLVKCEFTLTCLTVGVTGTVEAQGMIHWNSNTSPAPRGMGTGGTGAGNSSSITVDTTASKDLTISFKWSAAVVGCSFTVRSGSIEISK